MITTTSVLDDYLAEITMFAQGLSPERRAELLSGIAEHFREAQAEGSVNDVDSARALVARLGDPEMIVRDAGAADDITDPHSTPLSRLRSTHTELAAVLWLTIGSFLPLVGWFIGLRIVWTSRLWSARDRVVAALVIPGGPFVALLLAGQLAALTHFTCSFGSSGTIGTLDGPVTSMTPVAHACTQPTLNPTLGLLLAVLLLAASLAGPFHLWQRAQATQRRVTPGA